MAQRKMLNNWVQLAQRLLEQGAGELLKALINVIYQYRPQDRASTLTEALVDAGIRLQHYHCLS